MTRDTPYLSVYVSVFVYVYVHVYDCMRTCTRTRARVHARARGRGAGRTGTLAANTKETMLSRGRRRGAATPSERRFAAGRVLIILLFVSLLVV